jgi:predicted PurR-regulated permease PerM
LDNNVDRQAMVISRRRSSAIILLLSFGLLLALPFALSAGQGFFLPVVAAAVITIILAPVANILEKLRIPNVIASFIAIIFFAGLLTLAIFLIFQPAMDLFEQLPVIVNFVTQKLTEPGSLAVPLSTISAGLSEALRASAEAEVMVQTSSMFQAVAFATPFVIAQILLALLTSYLMLVSRAKFYQALLRERTTISATRKVGLAVREISNSVSHYLGTVIIINSCVGLIVSVGAWLFGLESPLMWGGLAAILNFIPYVGPLVLAILLGITGVLDEGTLIAGLLPAAAYLGLQTIEANLITPSVLGERLSINPVLIIIAVSFFSWIWGLVGALLSIPLLVILRILLNHTGTPNIIGFLLGEPLFGPSMTGTEK